MTTLRDMNFPFMDDGGYIPTSTRTSLVNCLHGSAGFRTDCRIAAKRTMSGIISQTKRTMRFPQKRKQEKSSITYVQISRRIYILENEADNHNSRLLSVKDDICL